jgi:CBS domain containing-hemolysin-like protein
MASSGAGTLTAEDEEFQILGGFVMHHLGRVPRTGDVFPAEVDPQSCA